MKKIDARGLLCPQPVLMTKDALVDSPDAVLVTVDNAAAGQNVSRFLTNQGYSVKLTAENDDITIEGHRKAAPAAAATCSSPRVVTGGSAVLITHLTLGGNDAELGEVLMKAFLGTLPQLDDRRPRTVALMNEGVKLALAGSPTCEALQTYAASGGQVLVCGTCLKHFGLGDRIGVGTASNMFEILEAMLEGNALTI